MKVATAFVEVRPDTKNFGRDLDREVTDKAKRASISLGQALSAGAFLAGANKAIDASSRLEQAVGGTAAVFGEAKGQVEEFAKGAAESAGLSERAARELTSALGGLLKGFGFTGQEAANLSTELATLGADLAATFGGSPEEAVQALGAALRGETDPLERFGIALNQTLVNQRAVELGLASTTSAVDQHAKAQATLSLITERSADAQGQFAREADTAAGQAAISAAKVENSAADLGEALLPIYSKVQQTVGAVADAFGSLPEPVQTATIALLGIVAVGPTIKSGLETLGGVLGKLTGPLTKTGDAATGASGGLTRMGKAVGALGLVGGVAAAAAYANSLSQVSIDVERAAAALADLNDAEAEQVQQGILAADRFNQLDEVVRQLADGNVLAAERFLEQAEAAGITGERLEELRQIVEDKRGADVQGAKDQATYAEQVAAAGKESATAAGKIDKQADALDRAKDSLDKFKDGFDAAFADLDLEELIDRRTQDIADLAEKVAEHGAALQGDTEAALSNRDAVRNLAGDIGDIIEKHRDEGTELEELIRIRNIERQGLIDHLTQMGFNRTEIGRYVDALDAIPLTKATTVTADTATAEANVRRLLGVISLLPGSVDAAQAEKFLAREAFAPGHALGGTVQDGLFTVGEHGTELLSKTGSRVDIIAAGQPTPVVATSDADLELLMEMRENNRLLRSIVNQQPPSDTGTGLRRTVEVA